ncbi:carbohydrate porin [Sphingobium sp.]|uniref:carbohydrate porin n=1 Tax=Sphingobium sp. TaxID=1912891 RepID=UPI0039C90E9B
MPAIRSASRRATRLQLAALAIEQNLFDGKLNISGGRVSPLTYFNESNIYCTFQNNSVCFNEIATLCRLSHAIFRSLGADRPVSINCWSKPIARSTCRHDRF